MFAIMYMQNKNALKCIKMFAITTTITTIFQNLFRTVSYRYFHKKLKKIAKKVLTIGVTYVII